MCGSSASSTPQTAEQPNLLSTGNNVEHSDYGLTDYGFTDNRVTIQCDGYYSNNDYNGYHGYDEDDDGNDVGWDDAKFCDFDDIDWNATKRRLQRIQLRPKRTSKTSRKSVKSNRGKMKKSIGMIGSLASSVRSALSVEEKLTKKSKMHSLQIRVHLKLNLSPEKSSENCRIWKFDRSTGKHLDFYRKYNYVLCRCQIEIYDESTAKYWDSVTFIPYTVDQIDKYVFTEWTKAQIPVFVKMRPHQACAAVKFESALKLQHFGRSTHFH